MTSGSERHFTASVIVLDDADHVLLIHHVKAACWLYPGGHVEAGETLAEAAVRETREETGVDATIITGTLPAHPPMTVHPVPFRVIEGRAADPVNGDHRHIDALFVCRATATVIGQVDQREATGARWVTLQEMRGLVVPPELPGITQAAIEWAASVSGPQLGSYE